MIKKIQFGCITSRNFIEFHKFQFPQSSWPIDLLLEEDQCRINIAKTAKLVEKYENCSHHIMPGQRLQDWVQGGNNNIIISSRHQLFLISTYFHVLISNHYLKFMIYSQPYKDNTYLLLSGERTVFLVCIIMILWTLLKKYLPIDYFQCRILHGISE